MERIELGNKPNGTTAFLNLEVYKAPFRKPIILQLSSVEPAVLEYDQDENGLLRFSVTGKDGSAPTVYFDLLNMDQEGGDELWERELDHLIVLISNGGRDQIALFHRPDDMTSLYPLLYDDNN